MTDLLYAARDIETPQRLPFDRALALLERGRVTEEHGLMGWGSNYTFLVSVADDEISALAIYKPRRGERPLWDFMSGTLCQRELAAFLTSEAIGWRLVPPTVLRQGPRGDGSLQLFIHHDPEEHFFTFDAAMAPQLKKMALFDYLTNNADRKGGHCLVDAERRLWGIDHGLTFNAIFKLRTVIWDYSGQPIPNALLADIERFCALLDDPNSAYLNALCGLLDENEQQAFRARVQQLLASKKFPLPGPGPNRPWPPI